MSQEKYICMDVHAATISAAVKYAEGKLLIDPHFGKRRKLVQTPVGVEKVRFRKTAKISGVENVSHGARENPPRRWAVDL